MRELFSMDLKNYNPMGKVNSRPSIRGISIRDGKVLLVYARNLDYYLVPGGGFEKGESEEEALTREMREETGYSVVPGSLREFGHVLRVQKDTDNEDEIFEQDNIYYFVEVSNQPEHPLKLDDYESEDGFEAVWMDPFEASHHNHFSKFTSKEDPIIVEREERILDVIDLELRRLKREEKEKKFLESLGIPSCSEMLSYVKDKLGTENFEKVSAKREINYSRFEHTKRVLLWTKRLYDAMEDKSELRYDDLIIAAIFHDVGRSSSKQLGIPHAKAGVPITREYLLSHGFDEARIEFICKLVGEHSDKGRMHDAGLDRNLLLLMEADLFDDMGALGITMDCMITMKRNSAAVFTDCLDHITRFTARIQKDNPMVTKEAKKFWDEKTKLVNNFCDSLSKDIELQ